LGTFPKAQYILDHPHLKSHLYDTATAWALEGSARHAWVSDHLEQFWAGEARQALKSWRAHQEHAPEERLRQLIDHVTRCEEGVDYGTSHERGWPLGAGEVESAPRYVPQERLKIAGACWNPDNVNSMWLLLDSRVVELSRSSVPTFATLSSLNPLFFNGLRNALRFLDKVGA
jgi:hypothetical protein